MTDILFAGYHEARDAGLLAGSPDIRLALVMSGFSADADAVHLDDVTLDEFDGVGYARPTLTSVVAGYVAAADQWRITCDSPISFGDPVGPSGDVIQGIVAILHIDGTDAGDYILWYVEPAGVGVDANTGAVSWTLTDDLLFFDRQVAA